MSTFTPQPVAISGATIVNASDGHLSTDGQTSAFGRSRKAIGPYRKPSTTPARTRPRLRICYIG